MARHEHPQRRAQWPEECPHQTQRPHWNHHLSKCHPWTHTCPPSPTRSQTTPSGVSNIQPSPKSRINLTASRCALFTNKYFAMPLTSSPCSGGGSTATSDTYKDLLSTKQKRAKHGQSRPPGGMYPTFSAGATYAEKKREVAECINRKTHIKISELVEELLKNQLLKAVS